MVTLWLTSKENPKSQNISDKAGRVLAHVIWNSCDGLIYRWVPLKVTIKLCCQRDMDLKNIKLQVCDSESVSHSVYVFHFSFLLLILLLSARRESTAQLHLWRHFFNSEKILSHSHTLRLKNSQHFTTPSLVSPRNDVWGGATTEIPYWWHVSTQIWVVLLIG